MACDELLEKAWLLHPNGSNQRWPKELGAEVHLLQLQPKQISGPEHLLQVAVQEGWLLENHMGRELHDAYHVGHIPLDLVDGEGQHVRGAREQPHDLIDCEAKPLQISDLAAQGVQAGDGNEAEGILVHGGIPGKAGSAEQVQLLIVEPRSKNDGGAGDE